MSDRFNAIIVTLETDVGEEVADRLISAITQMRGVSSAKANVADIGSALAEERVRSAYRKLLWGVFFAEDAKP
jgi:archaellum biogenesis protein FlaJ (TadC family)